MKLATAAFAAATLVGSTLIIGGVAVQSSSQQAQAAVPVKLTPAQRDQRTHGVVIDRYEVCLTGVQACVDRGVLAYSENRRQATGVLQGHNWAGWQWLSGVPVGTVVTVTGGPAAGEYRVFGHEFTEGQGVAYPGFRGAALVLQTCVGSGTGYTLMNRA